MDYKYLFKPCFLFVLIGFAFIAKSQTMQVVDAKTKEPMADVEVYNATSGGHTMTDAQGFFTDDSTHEFNSIYFVKEGYELLNYKLALPLTEDLVFELETQNLELDAVVIRGQQELLGRIRRLKDVENTEIYAAKKSEVVQVENIIANKASNNARQIYAQVTGLNIYEDCSGGLQLNIGGRGLDPNRSANFNTRQNSYDISADVLGYPESYYTPPSEAIREIQVIRGAASLQYGTQLGGLINFKLVEPSPREFAGKVRLSGSSFDTYSGFAQGSGTINNVKYLGYAQYKNGNCYRDNSQYNSLNAFGKANIAIGERSNFTTEFTHMNSLSQQPGGLTDAQFYKDASYTNRERNWFDVDWNLLSNRFEHDFEHNNAKLSVSLNGLSAERSSLGFRVNRVSTLDVENANRDLIVGKFRNWSTEARYLQDYQIGNLTPTGLLGVKYYQAKNHSQQGAGSTGTDADFSFQPNVVTELISRSDFEFPNKNLAIFTEHIFRLSDKLTAVPGVRYETINTESKGDFTRYNFDLAGNLINEQVTEDNRNFNRDFLLYGLGLSYKQNPEREVYANFTTNYRSVTFSDMRINNPNFVIDPNLTDETGYNLDFGYRGNIEDKLNFDVTAFGLQYDNRIGEIEAEGENFQVIRYRTNVGKAFNYGLESFAEWNITNTFDVNNRFVYASLFSNMSFIKSEYTQSQRSNVEGNEVEFTPGYNIKTGLRFGYRNLLGSFQFTTIDKQFTDATNAPQIKDENQTGTIGEIPAYQIADLSLSYKLDRFNFEAGINNLFDEIYFTRRATGYPGPGIIPSDRRSFYGTIEVRF